MVRMEAIEPRVLRDLLLAYPIRRRVILLIGDGMSEWRGGDECGEKQRVALTRTVRNALSDTQEHA
jgi:hypothetical protein